MNNIEIGNRIKNQRLQHGLTLQEVAADIGVTKSTILRYERGEIETIKLPVIEAIARALNVDPAWLIGKVDDPAPKKLSNLSTLNKNDERDIAKRMEELRDTLKSGDTLMFDGDPMDEETMKYVLDAMEVGLRTAKIINKEKYNPRKNKKD